MSTHPDTDLGPYKGLEPYRKDDREFFFGRKSDTEVIVTNLSTTELTVLYGVSGVGKSSVLMAGVEPALVDLEQNGTGKRKRARHALVIFRDWQSKNLLPTLRAKVRHAVSQNAIASVKDDPRHSFEEFLLQCNGVLGGPVFFIFDQFEEYLLYHSPSEDEDSFETQFARIVNSRAVKANFLLSLREEDLSKLDRFQGRIPDLLGNMLRLEYLDRTSAEEAIRAPLAKYNTKLALPAGQQVQIEQALVTAVLDQAQLGKTVFDGTGKGQPREKTSDPATNGRIETPILQMVMSRLWAEEVRAGSRMLRLETFTQLGEGQKIISTHLDRMMDKLGPAECNIAERLFLFLVTPTGTKIAYKLADLASPEFVGCCEAQLQPILDRLSAPDLRILRTVEVPGQPKRYEIYHDVLAPAILDWRRRYVAARETEKIKQEEEKLRAEALAKAEREKEKIREEEEHRRERVLAAAAEKRRQELMRNWRRAAYVFATCLIIIAILAGNISYKAYRERKLSRSRELAARAAVQLRLNPELSLLLAIRAVETEPTEQAEATLRQAFSYTRPTINFKGHKDIVSQASFSSDGQTIITASDDHTARVWSVATGRLLHELPHDGAVHGMALSGHLLATETNDAKGKVWDLNTGQELFPLTDLDGPVAVITFSRDGEQLLTETKTGAKLWNVAARTERLLRSGPIDAAQFSPDGKLVVTAPTDLFDSPLPALVWDAQTGRRVQTLPLPGVSVDYVAFSPNGKFLLMASDDSKQVVFWTTDTWHKLPPVEQMGVVKKAVFSPKGNYVAVISADGSNPQNPTRPAGQASADPNADGEGNLVEVWDTATLKRVAMLRGHTATVNSAAFSSDDRFIVTASNDKTARVWDVKSGQEITRLSGHEGRVTSAAFSPNDQLVVTSSADQTARVWKVDDLSKEHSLPLHAPVYSLAFSPNGQRILTASVTTKELFDENGAADQDALIGKPLVWDTASGNNALTLAGKDGPTVKTVYSPDGSKIAAYTLSGRVCVWDANTGEVLWADQSARGLLFNAPFSPDGRLFLTKVKNPDSPVVKEKDEKDTLKVIDLTTKQLLLELHPVGRKVNSASFSPNGQSIVTASGDYIKYSTSRDGIKQTPETAEELKENYTAQVFKTATGERIWTFQHDGPVLAAAFNVDGTLIVTASADATAKLWNVQTGKLVASLDHSGVVYTAEFSPNGHYIVTVCEDRNARLWDGYSGKSIAQFEHPSLVLSAQFSPTSRFVLTRSRDYVTRLWDINTTQELFELTSFDSVYDAIFSPDGKLIAVAGSDNPVRIYTCDVCLPLPDLMQLAKQRVTRQLTEEELNIY
ncbi:MAG: PQQ-binding-like beta-propeller repeat protein [Pyrinomonadaceae bacterium]